MQLAAIGLLLGTRRSPADGIRGRRRLVWLAAGVTASMAAVVAASVAMAAVGTADLWTGARLAVGVPLAVVLACACGESLRASVAARQYPVT